MPKENSQKIYFIVGPTASGKTALSIELAKKLGNCEIISCDSRQIFRDFDLATGKVTKEEMGPIPHHMLDIVDPGQEFSVVDFTNMALEQIEDIFSRGKTPIICGGTGFYVDNLIYDYKLPSVPKNEDLRKELEPKTTKELYLILKDLERQDSSFIPVQMQLAKSAIKTGQMEKAAARLEKLIVKYPKNERVICMLAEVYAVMKNPKAEELAKRCK